jgi:DNA segregation ATPase FtsK/SpoIIIE-like protein
MASTAAAVPAAVGPLHHAHTHDHQSPAEYALPASLIATRPILPLPKRRLPSSSSTATNPPQSSTTSPSSTTNPLSTSPTQTQIFSHTYPLAVSSLPTADRSLLPPYLPTDAEESESDDDDAYSSGWTFSREDSNTSNKKKRKIPLSATSNAPLGSVTVDGSTVSSPGSGTRVLGSKTGPSSATAAGRLTGWRVPSATMRSEGGYLRRTKARRSVEPEETVNGVVPGIVGSVPSTPEMTPSGNEEDTSSTSPAPSGPFSFSCPSPLSAPLASMVPPSLKSTSTANGGGTYIGQPSAPPTAPLPIPPPPPPAAVDHATQQQAYAQTAQVSAQTQTTANPQAPAQPGQPAQQGQQQQQPRIPTQGIKHPNSEKARRVAQLTKLRERWRTGPKPEPVLPLNPPQKSIYLFLDFNAFCVCRMKFTSARFVRTVSSTEKTQSTSSANTTANVSRKSAPVANVAKCSKKHE